MTLANRKLRRAAQRPGPKPPEFQQGVTLAEQGDYRGALALFRKAQAIRPSADIIANIGFCLKQLGEIEQGEAHYRQALAIDPDHVNCRSNLATILNDRCDFEQSEQVLRRALELEPDNLPVLVNLSNTVYGLGRYDEAEALLRHAIALAPQQPQAHKNLGNLMLLRGRLREGFADYEWRLLFPDVALALDGDRFGKPRWTGQDLAGKTLLAVSEQGMGDTLNFVRYGALVRARGGRMLVTAQKPLVRLLRQCPVLDGLATDGEKAPAFDYHVPLLSLPTVFGTEMDSIPADIPYFAVHDDWRAKWRAFLGPRKRPRIGLVWAGSTGHKNDANRSLPIELLAPLVDDERIDVYGLQVEMRPEHRPFLAAHPRFKQLGLFVEDYADTAALLEQIDLLITVDTSVAHLAGGLGRPVWTMLPFVPDWRWLLDRSDTPWYPDMRLFRQSGRGDWAGVLAEVRVALDGFLLGRT